MEGILFLFIIVIIWYSVKYSKERRLETEFRGYADTFKSLDQHICRIIEPHLDVLAKKRKKLIYITDYGTEELSDWQAEKMYFIESIVRPKLSESEIADLEFFDISGLIEDALIEVKLRHDSTSSSEK